MPGVTRTVTMRTPQHQHPVAIVQQDDECHAMQPDHRTPVPFTARHLNVDLPEPDHFPEYVVARRYAASGTALSGSVWVGRPTVPTIVLHWHLSGWTEQTRCHCTLSDEIRLADRHQPRVCAHSGGSLGNEGIAANHVDLGWVALSKIDVAFEGRGQLIGMVQCLYTSLVDCLLLAGSR